MPAKSPQCLDRCQRFSAFSTRAWPSAGKTWMRKPKVRPSWIRCSGGALGSACFVLDEATARMAKPNEPLPLLSTRTPGVKSHVVRGLYLCPLQITKADDAQLRRWPSMVGGRRGRGGGPAEKTWEGSLGWGGGRFRCGFSGWKGRQISKPSRAVPPKGASVAPHATALVRGHPGVAAFMVCLMLVWA